MLELLAANNLAACRQANNWIQASHFPASDSQATAVLYSKHPQTKNSFNHLAACLNMLRTVSSTWLGHCFQKCKIIKKQFLTRCWHCLKPLHGLGSGPLVPLSDLSHQAENSEATATYCYLQSSTIILSL